MTDWFRTAFGQEYLTLYAHRNQEEAARLAKLILEKTKAGWQGPSTADNRIAQNVANIQSSGVGGEQLGAPARELSNVGTPAREPFSDAGQRWRLLRILDAPCGAGRHMRAFEQLGLRTYGFDLSEPLLREAAHHLPRNRIVRGDLRAIPYKAGSFDLVVNLFSSLGYFPDDKTNYDVLGSLVSLCKPAGWLVIDFMHSDYIHKNLQPESGRTTPGGIHVHDRRWIDGTPPRVKKQTTLTLPDGTTKTLNESVRLFSPGELRQQLRSCGLTVEMEFGDYAGAPFSRESKRIILMGKRQ